MAVMKAVIVDDERLSRRALRAQLERRDDVRVVAECGDGRSALAAIEREEPDLLFLDIRMPHLDGFQVLERLPAARQPLVVFVTAYDEHAIRAFDVQALDYLLKPFDEQRLNEAVSRAIARRGEQQAAAGMNGLLRNLDADESRPKQGPAQRLLVRRTGHAYFVPIERIDWIEANGDHVRVHAGSDVHRMRASIGALEHRLDPARFMRIHRSTIVNLDRVVRIEPYGGSDYQVVLEDGTRLRVSRSSRDRLLCSAP